MNRGIALLVVAFALVAVAGMAVAGPVGTAVAQDDPATTNETSERNGTQPVNGTDISPGERFSGVIGVQRAEIAGEVESRAFEVGLNRTASPEERAALVAERLNRTEERLAAIERRQRELRERREAGELTPGGFAARMAATTARAETIKREANRSADVAEELPESVRADRGLSRERLGELRERAGNASGPEVSAIARGIAGNDVGGPLASDRRGPPEDVGGAPEAGEGLEPGDADGPGERPGNGSGSGNGPGAGEGAGPGNGSGSGNGPGVGEGAGPGNGSGSGNGPGAGEGRGVGGGGPSERGNGTAGNATADGENATNAVRPPKGSGNASADRGASGTEDRSGGNRSGEGAGSSSSAAGEERGNSSAAGEDAMNAVGSATNRLVEPLIAGVDTVRHVLAGIGG